MIKEIMKTPIVCLMCGLPFLAAPVAPAAVPQPTPQRPNFLLIIADDLNWRDLGFTGNTEVKTPNLDRLRTESLYLSQMFTPAPTCSPTRHALYTGLYSMRSGAYPNHTRVYKGTKSIFTHLKGAGYRVALQGKEHVGPKPSFPYEHLADTDSFTATRDFVARDAQQPWLMVYASHDPHGPWDRGPKNLHDPAKITIPSYLHDTPVTRQMRASYYAEINQLDTQVGELLKLLDTTGQAKNTVVMFVSEQGSSLPYGGKWSLYDNGIRAASLVRWPGKVKPGSTSDAMMQYTDVTPTFLAAAGLDPQKIDVGCPDATGAKGFDGRNFMDVLTGKAKKLREYVYAQHTTVGINGYKEPYPIRAVRDTHYKYIRNLAPQNTYEIGGIHKGQPLSSWKEDAKTNPALAKRIDWLYHRPAEELYDLSNDEFETKNLANDPKLTSVKARLSKELDRWMAQQGDKGMETELKAPSRQGKAEGKGQTNN